jgi:hypothetical protein
VCVCVSSSCSSSSSSSSFVRFLFVFQAGLRTPCPAGRYGDAASLRSAGCSGPCLAGFWCAAGATSPRQHPCPPAATTTRAAGSKTTESYFCPEGTPVGPIVIRPGTYTDPDASGTAHAPAIAVPCSPGHYCPNTGRQIECPAGRWGASEGLSHSYCDGPCDPGFWCGAKSTTPRQHACGAVDRLCPIGSADDTARVHPGYYSLPEASPEDQRSAETRCGPGYWCRAGKRFLCAPGVYGNAYGQTAPTCTAPCPEGFYCPAGTVIPKPCGAVDYYCPLGSPTPRRVTAGYHTYRLDAGVPYLGAVREAWTPGSAAREIEVGVVGADAERVGTDPSEQSARRNPALVASPDGPGTPAQNGTEDGSSRVTFRAGRFVVRQDPDTTQGTRSHQKLCVCRCEERPRNSIWPP